jgi:hypothetical protein
MKITKQQLRKIIKEQVGRQRGPTPAQILKAEDDNPGSVNWRVLRDAQKNIWNRYTKRHGGYTGHNEDQITRSIMNYLDRAGLHTADISAIAEEIVLMFRFKS